MTFYVFWVVTQRFLEHWLDLSDVLPVEPFTPNSILVDFAEITMSDS